MITFLRRIVFFGAVLLSVLGIVLMLAQNETEHPPSELKTAMLSLIFLLGIILIIVIAKRGLADK